MTDRDGKRDPDQEVREVVDSLGDVLEQLREVLAELERSGWRPPDAT